MPEPTQSDLPPRYRHTDEQPWEALRWPGQESKMMFHPRPERPTEPNAGLVRYEPGSYHPRHRHDFAQVWYILEGEFRIGGEAVRSGHQGLPRRPAFRGAAVDRDRRPHAVRAVPRPDHRWPAIYDGRFNLKERRPVEEETVEV